MSYPFLWSWGGEAVETSGPPKRRKVPCNSLEQTSVMPGTSLEMVGMHKGRA